MSKDKFKRISLEEAQEHYYPKPEEYPYHFKNYEYLTEIEAEQMLDDPYVLDSVKKELLEVLR